MFNRREVLAALSAAPVALAGLASAAASTPVSPPKVRLGLVIHSYWIRSKQPLPPDFPDVADPVRFLEHAAGVGAAGVQTRIGLKTDDELHRIRTTAEANGLYVEGIVGLPKDEADVPRFTAELKSNRTAGADIVRTVCLNERRYERFDTADQFKAFVEQAWRSLRLAEPIAARHQVRLAVENHKDWRVDEMVGWLKRLGSVWVGVCLDTGNSVALLEDPDEVIKAYAPFAFTTHFKDVAVAEYEDGFLLAEVPLGDGIVDLPNAVRTLTRAKPNVRFNLEMITRDPLKIPCLTDRYWATLGGVSGRDLAGALTRVRHHKPAKPLLTVSTLDHRTQLRFEETHIDRCLKYSRDTLGL